MLGKPLLFPFSSPSFSFLMLCCRGKEKQTHHSLLQLQLLTEVLIDSLKLQKREDTNLAKGFTLFHLLTVSAELPETLLVFQRKLKC